jgi:hypothetical protein
MKGDITVCCRPGRSSMICRSASAMSVMVTTCSMRNTMVSPTVSVPPVSASAKNAASVPGTKSTSSSATPCSAGSPDTSSVTRSVSSISAVKVATYVPGAPDWSMMDGDEAALVPACGYIPHHVYTCVNTGYSSYSYRPERSRR